MNCKYSREKTRVLFVGLLLVAGTFFAGCSLDTPTAFSGKRLEVVQELYQSEVNTGDVNEALLGQIAQRYNENGDGEMDVVVSYNPDLRSNSAMTATENASRIARILAKNDVHDVVARIFPVKASEKSVSYFSYKSYTARPPTGCNTIDDVDDTEYENYDDYKLGCSLETYMAKQVSNPRDLLGRAGIDSSDGRRVGNVIEQGYKDGIPNADLQGGTASQQ